MGAGNAHDWLCGMKHRGIAWEKSIRHEDYKQIFYSAFLLPLLRACLPLAIFPVSLAPALGSRSESYVQEKTAFFSSGERLSCTLGPGTLISTQGW